LSIQKGERERKKILFEKRRTPKLAVFKQTYFNLLESILKTIQEKIFVRLVNREQDSLFIAMQKTQL